MRKSDYLIFTCLFSLSACFGSHHKQQVIIDDVSKPIKKDIRIITEPDEHVDKLTVSITGNINDTVVIDGIVIPPGLINFIDKGDYYDEEREFSYDPKNATEGYIVVEYDFFAF